MADTQSQRQTMPNGNINPTKKQIVNILDSNFTPQVRRIVYWESVPVSLACFTSLLLLLVTFSVYPGIHATVLLMLAAYAVSALFSLSHLLYCVTAGREPSNPLKEWLTQFRIDREWTLNFFSLILDILSPRIIKLLQLLLFFNLRDSIAGLILLWILSYFTPYISLLEISYIALFTIFTVPKLYEKYQEQIDSLIHRAIQRTRAVKQRFFESDQPKAKSE